MAPTDRLSSTATKLGQSSCSQQVGWIGLNSSLTVWKPANTSTWRKKRLWLLLACLTSHGALTPELFSKTSTPQKRGPARSCFPQYALNFRLFGWASSAHDARGRVGCVTGEIGKILRASLTELRCTAIEAG